MRRLFGAPALVLITGCTTVAKKVAQRIVRYAEIVGRERVLAGSDCGFGPGSGAESCVE